MGAFSLLVQLTLNTATVTTSAGSLSYVLPYSYHDFFFPGLMGSPFLPPALKGRCAEQLKKRGTGTLKVPRAISMAHLRGSFDV